MEKIHTKLGYSKALIELAGRLPELVVLDADVAKATSTCDFQDQYPDRFFNCGAAEQNELSVAAGLALEGFLPFASTFGMFATARAADQLRNSIAYPELNVKIGATHSGLTTGGDGASHQANEDLAMTRALPNMNVFVPGDFEEAYQVTLTAAAINGPCYLRFGRDKYPVVPEIHQEVQLGRAKIIRPVAEILLVTTGIMISTALEAEALLQAKGIRVAILHYPCLKPFDEKTLLGFAEQAKGVVTVEEHSIIGGLGDAVAACLGEHLPRPLRRIGVKDVFGESGQAAELLEKYDLSPDTVIRKVESLLN